MRGKMKYFFLLLLGLIILTMAIGFLLRKQKISITMDDRAYLGMYREVLTLVKKNYVEKVDDKKLLESSINGMLASLDPHSAYMPPEPFKEMNIQISGSFGGVGIELSMKNDLLTVVSPIQDTPAFRAGIRSNDYIYRIDSKFTKGMGIEDAVKLMRGKPGTNVTLTIIREGTSQPLVFPLTRAIIRISSLRSKTVEPGYGYIGISQFQERTGEDFVKALKTLKEQNEGKLRGLVIDLRYNPGGLVESAVSVAGNFIGEGLDSDGTIVAIRGREKSSTITHYARIGEKEPHYPIVVLINGGSASASEILAGALQDHKRAVIMGTQSFGKGSVQSVLPLRESAGLKITTAKYYTPKGRSIQAKGITPDIIVASVDLDKARKKQEESFQEKDLDNHLSEGNSNGKNPTPAPPVPVKEDPPAEKKSAPEKKSMKIPEGKADYQLSRAVELLKGLELMHTLNPQKK